MAINVDSLNRAFPKYPITIRDKGWVYGVWYCGTSYTKVKLYGQYPPTFLKRALALFPNIENILHCPSGTVTGPGLTIDGTIDSIRCPKIVADAKSLPLADNSIDLVLSDPPYSAEDSAIYGHKPFPMNRFMKECHRVIRPGGYLGMLHIRYPMHHRKQWKLVGLIAVVTGSGRLTRIFSIFERLDRLPDLFERGHKWETIQ